MKSRFTSFYSASGFYALSFVFFTALAVKASAENSVAIPQEVSEIRVKPTNSLHAEEGVRELSRIQGMYRENLVVSRTATHPAASSSRPRMLVKRVRVKSVARNVKKPAQKKASTLAE